MLFVDNEYHGIAEAVLEKKQYIWCQNEKKNPLILYQIVKSKDSTGHKAKSDDCYKQIVTLLLYIVLL